MFAEKYLKKQNRDTLINHEPDPGLGIILVVPCLREPDILQTLDSLEHCRMPSCSVEVLVVINHSEIASQATKSFNAQTHAEIEKWILNYQGGIKFYCLGPVELKKKWAGAGLARKKGMDEAVSRFNQINNPNGLIVSLDADTLVDDNYLYEIEKHYRLHPKNIGATISFEHQKNDLDHKQLEGIELYEKYLSYYKRALNYTGYPHSMFTIGSAFTVRAFAYVKRGGMNRRQAGEDFYFLQNLVQLGTVGEISSTKVYPSARLSDRVPFGTGPILRKWMTGDEDLTVTYNFGAFTDLKKLFTIKEQLFKVNESGYRSLISTLPVSICTFLKEDNFFIELDDLNSNCASLKSFNSRFFQKFNAFKILKYLNFAHENHYKKADLKEQLNQLSNAIKIS